MSKVNKNAFCKITKTCQTEVHQGSESIHLVEIIDDKLLVYAGNSLIFHNFGRMKRTFSGVYCCSLKEVGILYKGKTFQKVNVRGI